MVGLSVGGRAAATCLLDLVAGRWRRVRAGWFSIAASGGCWAAAAAGEEEPPWCELVLRRNVIYQLQCRWV